MTRVVNRRSSIDIFRLFATLRALSLLHIHQRLYRSDTCGGNDDR